MPLYEYECDACGDVFSELRKVSEREAPISCPACGGEAHAIMSMFAQAGGSSSSSGIGASGSSGAGLARTCSDSFT